MWRKATAVGKPGRRESGASAVEFAILMPLLFLVIAGIVDFGRAFFIQIQLANAAREGARAAVVLINDSSANTKVVDRATAAAPAVQSLSISPLTLCTPTVGATASVTAQAPIAWIIMGPAIELIGASWAPNGTLSSTAVMQCG